MPILPKKLEIHGYFAFREPQVIDFEALWKSGGLWGILGPNGAGKSSILEAILLALYHNSPRKNSDSAIKTLGFSGNPYIHFYFDYNGTTYVCAFPSKERERLANKMKGGPKLTLLNSKEVQNMLGLRYEDFILTVVLPQGKFANLLESPLAEQSRILSSFLPDKPWEVIVERAKKVQSFLTGALSGLEGKRATYETQLKQLSEVSPQTLEDLKNRIQALEARRNVIDEHLKQLNIQLENAKRRDQLQEKYDILSKNLHNICSQKEALEKTLNPDILQLLTNIDQLNRSLMDIEKQLSAKTTSAKAKNSEREQLEKQISTITEKYEKLRPLYENQAPLLELKSLHKYYKETQQNLNNQLTDLAKKVEQLKDHSLILPSEQAKNLIDFFKNKLTQGDGFWEGVAELEKKVHEDLQRAREEQEKLKVDKALGSFVAQLREGDPCPICGSTHHPKKRDIPSDIDKKLREVEARIKALERDKDRLGAIRSQKDSVERDLQTYLQRENELKQRAKPLCEKLGRETVAAFLQSSDSDKQFEQAKQLKEQIQKLNEGLSQIKGFLVSLEAEIKERKKQLEECKVEYKEAQEQLTQHLPEEVPWYKDFRQLLTQKGLREAQEWARKKLEEANKQIEEYELLHKQLFGEDSIYRNLRPTDDLQQEKNRLSAELSGTQRQIDQANTEKGKLENELKRKAELETLLEKTREEIKALESEQELIKRLADTTKGGELEKFFVRQVLLRPLIEEVNSYLREWLGGSLELMMPEDSGDKNAQKQELLRVRDIFSVQSESRTPQTLSGGEKFLVSLAMALSLSDRIMRLRSKNAKSQPSFFFIDEGFDTLSTENFAFVMRTLQRLAAQGRYIGLISHKIEAQEYLSAYLKVTKENHATKVKLYYQNGQ